MIVFLMTISICSLEIGDEFNYDGLVLVLIDKDMNCEITGYKWVNESIDIKFKTLKLFSESLTSIQNLSIEKMRIINTSEHQSSLFFFRKTKNSEDKCTQFLISKIYNQVSMISTHFISNAKELNIQWKEQIIEFHKTINFIKDPIK